MYYGHSLLIITENSWLITHSQMVQFLQVASLNILQLLDPVIVDDLADMRRTADPCRLYLVRLLRQHSRLELVFQHAQMLIAQLLPLLLLLHIPLF